MNDNFPPDSAKLMQTIEIKLECLRLAFRADRSPSEIIAYAREYMAWLGVSQPQTTEATQPVQVPKMGRKKSDPDSSDKSQ